MQQRNWYSISIDLTTSRMHSPASKNIPTVMLNYLPLWCMPVFEQNMSLQKILETYFKRGGPMNEVHIDIV